MILRNYVKVLEYNMITNRKINIHFLGEMRIVKGSTYSMNPHNVDKYNNATLTPVLVDDISTAHI